MYSRLSSIQTEISISYCDRGMQTEDDYEDYFDGFLRIVDENKNH
jgi:hypothetical protein